jgi:hypothetical protein
MSGWISSKKTSPCHACPRLDQKEECPAATQTQSTESKLIGTQQITELIAAIFARDPNTAQAIRPTRAIAIESRDAGGLHSSREARPPKRKLDDCSAMEPFSPLQSSAKKKRGDKDDNRKTLVVRAYLKLRDESHVAEAQIKLGLDNDLAVDYAAAALRLKGRLRVSGDLRE